MGLLADVAVPPSNQRLGRVLLVNDKVKSGTEMERGEAERVHSGFEPLKHCNGTIIVNRGIVTGR